MFKKNITEIKASNAPGPAGPYSQAVAAGDMVFVSGQIPLEGKDSSLVPGGIREQTACVIENTERILKAAGTGLEKVVKVDIFLSDLKDLSGMNEVYASRFVSGTRPARCVVEAARLPKDVKIEMSCTAYR
ncbi:MAG: Rid family detoxifying hydrolase [Candidatus Omnitrophota bacterium]|nr:Rid family detoxifying hydrolase [Candidatus Omnitrophota bacterium]